MKKYESPSRNVYASASILSKSVLGPLKHVKLPSEHGAASSENFKNVHFTIVSDSGLEDLHIPSVSNFIKSKEDDHLSKMFPSIQTSGK